jgi:hypothetical protein
MWSLPIARLLPCSQQAACRLLHKIAFNDVFCVSRPSAPHHPDASDSREEFNRIPAARRRRQPVFFGRYITGRRSPGQAVAPIKRHGTVAQESMGSLVGYSNAPA